MNIDETGRAGEGRTEGVKFDTEMNYKHASIILKILKMLQISS